jgi:hypothetical protein
MFEFRRTPWLDGWMETLGRLPVFRSMAGFQVSDSRVFAHFILTIHLCIGKYLFAWILHRKGEEKL